MENGRARPERRKENFLLGEADLFFGAADLLLGKENLLSGKQSSATWTPKITTLEIKLSKAKSIK